MYVRPEPLDKKRYSSLWRRTPYVRHDRKKTVRDVRATWSWNIDSIDHMTVCSICTKYVWNVDKRQVNIKMPNVDFAH